MTTEVKPLTKAEAIVLLSNIYMDKDAKIAELRERGLIAPEPVDPLLEEAEALHQDWIARKHEDAIAMLIAALRRGMELRPQLTREQVRKAIIKADPCCLAKSDFRPTSQHLKGAEAFVDALHAALKAQVDPPSPE